MVWSLHSNSVLADISLKDYELGEGGRISVTITDLERKLNINIADEAALQQALRLVGVDAGDLSAISASILDWIDPDDNTHISGTESDYYQGLTPPYFAKNKPIDDLSELLLVRGVTPEIYWGGVATNHQRAAFQNQLGRMGAGFEAPRVRGRLVGSLHADFQRKDQHQHGVGGSAPVDPGCR